MSDVQVIFLQGQTPPLYSLIFVFHPVDESEGIVICEDKHWVYGGTQISLLPQP